MPLQSADNSRHPLQGICKTWLAKIELARKAKQERFGKWAEEAMKFFDGAHDWMWSDHYAKGPAGFLSQESNSWMPTFRMTYNRMFEAVALLGPSLYFRNPNVQATPQPMPDIAPEALGIDPNNMFMVEAYQQAAWQQQMVHAQRGSWAELYTTILTWLQQSTNKRRHVRMAVADALIKGAGYLWCALDKPRGSSRKTVRSVWVNADDIVKDPDATDDEDVMWIGRYCCHPVNVVEEKYDHIPPGTLKGHMQSFAQEASNSTSTGQQRARKKFAFEQGKSFDLIEYWEIYSKNGFGERLQRQNMPLESNEIDTTQWGDFCHIVVAQGVPFPLNMPSNVMVRPPQDQPEQLQAWEEELFMLSQWPTPFWQDVPVSNGWPYAELGFYDKPGSVWKLSIFKPVAGEMRFINWCMSFLADKAASSCQTIVARAKSAGAEIQKQLGGATAPFQIMEIADIMGKSINEVVTFLQAPNFPVDIWHVIEAVDARIDKRLGLTELMYGLSSRQMRSATEAQVRDDNISIRPDDMANSVEDFVSASNLKEAEAMRYHLQAADVEPVVGPMGAAAWDQHLQSTDPDVVVREYSFHIEAGSARKPNKTNKVRQLQDFGQAAMPHFQALAMAGVIEPMNAFLHEMAKAMDLDPSPFLMQGPPPPPPEAAAQQQQGEQEMAQKEQAHQQGMVHDQIKQEQDSEKHSQSMQQQQEAHDAKLEQGKQQSQLKIAAMRQKRKEKVRA